MSEAQFRTRLAALIKRCPPRNPEDDADAATEAWHHDFEDFLLMCTDQQSTIALDLYQLHAQNDAEREAADDR